MWISLGEMTVMLIMLSVLLWHVCKQNYYRFILGTVLTMMLIDFTTIVLALSLYLEET